jgi:hypothetical protein
MYHDKIQELTLRERNIDGFSFDIERREGSILLHKKLVPSQYRQDID